MSDSLELPDIPEFYFCLYERTLKRWKRGVAWIRGGDTPQSYVRAGGDDPPLDSPGYKSTQLRHPKQPLLYLPQSLTELTGPALGDDARIGALDHDLTAQHAGAPIGERLVVTGRVFDTEGKPLRGTLVETWQADPAGRFADLHGAGADGPSQLEGFRGFGRCGHEAGDGTYTVKPGRVPVRVAGQDDEVLQAPHVDVSLFARGLLDRVVTRIYFGDEAEANAQDPVLRSVPEDRRATLIAQPDGDGSYRFDVRLQGESETVFFAV